jgi:hypothetical protein
VILRSTFAWLFLAFPLVAAEPEATRLFAVKNDRAYLGGQEVKLWGIRCGNALYSPAVTERHITNLDNMARHGINCIGVYIQGSNGGWPDPEAGLNGFSRDGKLKPAVAERLEAIIRAADKHGMVVMVGVCSPRKDQFFYDEAAIQTAMEETGKFLTERKLRNVFVDIMHEYNNADRIDHAIFREPNGPSKKAKLTAWFAAMAPDVPVGICPAIDTGTADTYPGMTVRIIQKGMKIPAKGWVVNVETPRFDEYSNDGVFKKSDRDDIRMMLKSYQDAPNAAMLFHAAYIMGITNASKTAPHPEMGGMGTGPDDRGVKFYYDWVRDNVGEWKYPKHVPFKE